MIGWFLFDGLISFIVGGIVASFLWVWYMNKQDK
jgi:hypothetical protein